MIEDNGHVVFILGCSRSYGMAFMSGTMESELVESTLSCTLGPDSF